MPSRNFSRSRDSNTSDQAVMDVVKLRYNYPKTLASEKRVLARLILKGKRETGIGALNEDDFSTVYHKKVFQAYSEVSRRIPEFDELIVLNEAKLLLQGNDSDSRNLEDAFDEIISTGGTPNLEDDISNLKLYTKKRRLIDVCVDALTESKKPNPDIPSLIDKLSQVKAGNVKLKPFQKIVDDTIELLKLRWQRRGEIMGITSTISNIDRATGGFMPGETVIVAGRPGSGKSLYLSSIALENLKLGKKVLYLSLEMQEIEVLERMVARELQIDSYLVSSPVSDEMKTQIEECLKNIESYPLSFADNLFTLEDIISAMWYQKETEGLDLIIIDYLQLINPGNRRFQSDNSAISHISRQLKETAQQLGVPIIMGSQLNRQTDMREDQSPRLSDLRDSGSLEQDASVVIALHFHEIMEDKTDNSGEVIKGRGGETKQVSTGKWRTDGLILLKNRRGRANFEVPINFDPKTGTFSISQAEATSEEAIKIFSEALPYADN